MTTTKISSLSLQNSLRSMVLTTQADLNRARREVTTGTFDDYGLSLGAHMTRSVDLSGELTRLDNLKSTNSIVNQRLQASQESLNQVAKNAQTILNSLVSLSGNVDKQSISTTTETIRSSFNAITSAANMSLNGEYLFAGINTDVKPLTDYSDPTSPAKTAYDTALNTFLAAQVPVLTGPEQMSAAQITDFITNTLKPSFMGTDWTTNWSSATDQNMTTRVNRNEIIETSSNTNSDGMRQIALAMVISTELLSKSLSTDARQAASTAAIDAIGQGIAGIDLQRGKLGLSQARVKEADANLDAQRTIIETHLSDLVSVDPYEASSRVKNLETMLEAAYSLTSRLHQLSLVNFL